MTTTPPSRFRCDIAVVGESLIDIVVAADGTRRERVGGGPATLARGLGRLGMATTLLTTFGADPHRPAIDHELSRCGVRVIQAGRPATRTSTTITHPTDPAPTPSTSGGNSPTPTSRRVLTCTSAPSPSCEHPAPRTWHDSSHASTRTRPSATTSLSGPRRWARGTPRSPESTRCSPAATSSS
ncbi:hypothetical protein FXW78_26410 [Rhodococcus opacus]|nr:hypothetical protein [Rhodococcus opacus]